MKIIPYFFVFNLSFGVMKLYNTLIKKDAKGKIEDIVLLKEGFSLFAFLFNIFWFLRYKMWKESLVLMVANIVLANVEKYSGDFNSTSLEVVLLLVVAFNANYWLFEHLKNKNYEFVGMVFGKDLEEAKLRFIENFEVDLNCKDMVSDSILDPKSYCRAQKIQKKSAA